MSQTKAQLIDPVDGTIVNADINASAAIAASKIADFVTGNVNNRVLTASGTANSLVGESGLLFISDSNDHILTLTGSGQAHLQLTSTSGSDHCSIDFGDSDDNDIGEIRYTNSTNAMHFDTNATLQMTLDSSGRLLLGTSTEGHENADDFTVAGSANTGITIRSGTSNFGQIFFSDGTSGDTEYRGIVGYSHSDNHMKFHTDAVERLRIDSTGRMSAGKHGIGTHNDASEYFKVQSDDTSANISIVGSNDTHSTLNMGDEDDFNIQKIKSDHTNNSLQFFTVDSERMRIDSSGRVFIGNTNPAASANADDLCVGNNDGAGETGITLGSNTASGIRWADGNSNSAAVFEYQHNNTRYAIASEGSTRVVIDADGIKFQGDTATANGLNDYEEGTFTPAMNQGINVSSYDSQNGFYVKIGDLVQVSFRIRLSGSGSSNHVRFQGLPFTSVNLSSYNAGGIVTFSNIPGLSSTGAGTASVWMGGNSTLCELYTDGNSSQATGSGGFTNKEIYIVITYRTA